MRINFFFFFWINLNQSCQAWISELGPVIMARPLISPAPLNRILICPKPFDLRHSGAVISDRCKFAPRSDALLCAPLRSVPTYRQLGNLSDFESHRCSISSACAHLGSSQFGYHKVLAYGVNTYPNFDL